MRQDLLLRARRAPDANLVHDSIEALAPAGGKRGQATLCSNLLSNLLRLRYNRAGLDWAALCSPLLAVLCCAAALLVWSSLA